LGSQGYRPVALTVCRTLSEEPLVTASVWHRPAVSDQAKDRLARRKARAAVASIRMERPENVWPLLRHSTDPSVRSYVVHWLKRLGARPNSLIAQLESIDDDKVSAPKEGRQVMDGILFDPKLSERRALILALGEYEAGALTVEEQERLEEKLLETYRNDPDAGIHGAAEWTLRRWKQEARLEAANAELKTHKFQGERRWYVNSEGQTFAVIDGPVEFQMGSSPSEPDREGGNKELLHRMRISRRFAVATKEVTVEQYQHFQRANDNIRTFVKVPECPDLQGPQFAVTWYDAARYCNWLSRQEGLQECYEPNQEGKYEEGMKVVAHVVDRSGYRLPTEAEWEYVCRAGAVTSRFYGRSTELLKEYAWFQDGSNLRAWACGHLKPNDFGMCDMIGNAYEWCQDGFYSYTATGYQLIINNYQNASIITEKPPHRVHRGGCYGSPASYCRSAHRLFEPPSIVMYPYGFRPVRTLRQSE